MRTDRSRSPSRRPRRRRTDGCGSGAFRSIWAAPEVGAAPALKFLHPSQRVELSLADAERIGVVHGDRVTVGSGGHRVTGTAHIRAAASEGSVFLETAIGEHSASALDGPLVEVAKA